MNDGWETRYGFPALVNNAGIQHDLRVDDAGYSAQDMRAEVEINLLAPMALTRALLPHLQAQQRAWVVNVGSVLGSCPKRTAAVYSATKAGLDLFTQALQEDPARSGPILARTGEARVSLPGGCAIGPRRAPARAHRRCARIPDAAIGDGDADMAAGTGTTRNLPSGF